jgi:hypothetical protein
MAGDIYKCTGRLILTAMALVSLFMLPIAANSATTNKRAVAVIIGNTNYQSRIPSVEFAGNDAEAFKTFVIEVLGYDPENVIDLRDATKAQMESTFGNERSHEGKLWRHIDPRGRSDVTVYYSGHGVPGMRDKRGYLLPVDADAETPEINGFSVDTLFDVLKKLKTRSLTVYLDACFSGDSQKGMLVKGTSGIAIAAKLPDNSSKMTVITAAQGDQVASWDFKAKHGMFTEHLLNALYGEADKSEYGNDDGSVSLSEIQEYLDDNLTSAARRQHGRNQNAWSSGKSIAVLSSPKSDVVRPKIEASVPAVQASVPAPKAKPDFNGLWSAEFNTSCAVSSPDFEVADNVAEFMGSGDGYPFSFDGKIEPDGSFGWTAYAGIFPLYFEGHFDAEKGEGTGTLSAGGECNGDIVFTKLK